MVVVVAGAVAAIETETVTSYWQGLWWSISLITTVGFIGQPPTTVAGAALSVMLMVVGFLLLAMLGASMAALFVKQDEQPRELIVESREEGILAALRDIQQRLDKIEQASADRDTGPNHSSA
jgi:hypothetical protein